MIQTKLHEPVETIFAYPINYKILIVRNMAEVMSYQCLLVTGNENVNILSNSWNFVQKTHKKALTKTIEEILTRIF